MTTGEKLAALRRKKAMTQEQLAEYLGVARQSVSRWEMDAAFPETEKLIRLSRLLDCSIDYLLNDALQETDGTVGGLTADDCCRFIRECGYYFLATSANDQPHLRPMGFVHSDGRSLYIATDPHKSVYAELLANPRAELACYNLNTRCWLRISGTLKPEHSAQVLDGMAAANPMIRQEYVGTDEVYLAVFRLNIHTAGIH